MEDNPPANAPSPAPGTPPPPKPPAEPADQALDAAQQAVDSLKNEAKSPVSAVAGGDDAAAAALKAAQAAVAQARELNADSPLSPPGATGGAAPFPLPKMTPASTAKKPEGIDLLADVNLNVRIELGRTRMLVEDVLRLGEGSVVELDKLAGDPVDVYVNDRHVAKGEVLVLNDNFCVRINEIVEQVAETR